MKSVVRISLVALLLAGFAAPASAAPATTPARHDDSASAFGKPYYDFCVFPPSLWCDRKNNRWFS
ncbi:hypothetical protein [Actinomyces oris]|uniref:hypothetical protein n=1 Tax=Actinomyces oris TaxID=544580 RepID=UPI00094D3D0C|nr:hypothetical protein [Actinomyces oris]OLO56353.1 hypothetical protein BKH26_06180 [Actinomyces oris]OLO61138.1 hypothetical protein BKH24_05205 [Actinomyces oris]